MESTNGGLQRAEQRDLADGTALRGSGYVGGQPFIVIENFGESLPVLGEGFLDRLRQWMRDGGTVITMAESTRWATGAGLLETVAERRGGLQLDI